MSKALPQFGSYEAVRRLGAGGMAETFVAVRRGPGGFEQKVCIKRVLPAYAEDQEFVEAFLREARTSATLRHANIVQVLDFGLAEGSYYLALELIDGLDLRALLQAQGDAGRRRLSADVVSLVAGELGAALEHAHASDDERGSVVHRDVSPSNVLVSPAGEVKLTDFGIARALGGTHLTRTGVIKGKIPYLPPEYIERGEFDQRGDLFSLGVLLFELLAGVRPFDGESDLDTVRRIVDGERSTLAELAPEAPAALVDCVERLLAHASAERFASASEFVDALPASSTHAARRELGALVDERVRAQRASGRLPAKSVPPVQVAAEDPGQAPTLTAPPPQGPTRIAVPTPATRTHKPPRKQPSRGRKGPLVALGGAGAALLALLVAMAFKGTDAIAGAHAAEPETRRARSPAASPDSSPAQASPSSPTLGPSTITLAATPPTARQLVSAPATPAPEAERTARAPAELRVVVFPFGDVWVDGKSLGHAPVSIKLPAGPHEIGVGDGRPDQRRSLVLHAGQHENLVFRREIDAR
ncbi:MAG: protein kinase [Myxococcales bacterium]